MNLFEFVESIVHFQPEEAFAKIKEHAGFSDYLKSEVPYYLQPDGNIYTLYAHDFVFTNGDVITYTAKDDQKSQQVLDGGNWDYYCYEKQTWFRYDDQEEEFVLHDTYRNHRDGKPKFSDHG